MDTAFWMLSLDEPDYPVRELGDLCLDISAKLRALAIINILAFSDSDRYYHNLIRSGVTWEKYLSRLIHEQIQDDHHQCSSRYESLVDAVAAGDFDLARRLISLSTKAWMEGHEYEDDYCYAQILHRLIQEPTAEKEIPPLILQFETYLEGQPGARLDICKALLEKDQSAFDEAFDALLNEQEAKIIADKERGQLEEPVVIANRLVFVEGLAILRLAEKQGLKTQTEYRYCPSLARVPMKTPFPGE